MAQLTALVGVLKIFQFVMKTRSENQRLKLEFSK